MAKQAKKAKKQGKKKSSKSTAMVTSVPKASIGFVKAVCGLTNPFCDEATEARWPDNTFTKSVPWNIHGLPNTQTTDVNGNVASLILPGLRPWCPAATPIVSPALSFSTLYYSGVTPPTGVARYRITSWGVMFRAIGTPLTLKGNVRIRLFSPMKGASLATSDLSTIMADANYDVPLARLVDRDLFVVPAPLGTSARLYRDFDTDNAITNISNFDNPGWQIIQYAVDGGPTSTAVLETKLFYHFEFVFKDGEAISAFATAPPASSPAVQHASAGLLERVGNFLTGTVETVDRLMQTRVGQLAGSAALSYITKSPGPMIGSGVKMIKDVY